MKATGSDNTDGAELREETLCVYKKIKSVTFVSSNAMKAAEVKSILADDTFPYKLNFQSLELSEPQATPIEVSQSKCKQAAEMIQGPCIVEDTSLCFNALNGMPGPYIKWFYEALGCEGLYKLLDGHEDKTGYAQCVVSFTLGPGEEVKTFVGIADGTIVQPTITNNFGWDPIFQPLGYKTAFSGMPKSEKNKLSHRFKALRQLKTYINSRTGS